MSVLERFQLDGQAAIVTGGNRGIGQAIAQGLAEAGADVVIANRTVETGRGAAEEISATTDSEAIAVETDVTSEDAVEGLIAETVEAFGSVDVLVNNAGVAFHGGAEEKSLAEWQKTIDINLTGTFLCSREAGNVMIEQGGGSIVNVTSMSAFVANYPQRHVDYQASKGGMEAFARQLASEWAQYGVRVNNIAPGYVATDILVDDEELLNTWKEEMLLPELADPEDIAPLAVYLASDASSYVTGESVTIDGGYTVR